MEKIKLVKRSENVNINYNNEGDSTQSLNGVSYAIINEETGETIGNADAYSGSLNIGIYGIINTVEKADEILNKLFNAFTTEEN